MTVREVMSRPVPADNSHAAAARAGNQAIVEREFAASRWKRLARERDIARVERDRALRQRDDLVLSRFQLLRERDALLAVRDQLARECIAIATDRDRLLQERGQSAAVAATRGNVQAVCEGAPPKSEFFPIGAVDEALAGDRDGLAKQRSEAIAERDAIAAELLLVAGQAEMLAARLNRMPGRWLRRKLRRLLDLFGLALRRVRVQTGRTRGRSPTLPCREPAASGSCRQDSIPVGAPAGRAAPP